MSIAVITLHTPEIESYATRTFSNKIEYCNFHKYPLISYYNRYDTDRIAAWSKIPLIQQQLSSHDWIVWLDADTVIMDFSIRLESLFERDFTIARDWNDINAGVFFIRNCKWSQKFLSQVWMKTDYDGKCRLGCPNCIYTTGGCEQRAIIHYCQEEENLSHVYISENSFFNECCPTYFDDGRFITHAAGLSIDLKQQYIEQLLQKVKR